jgi:hypothetical protein
MIDFRRFALLAAVTAAASAGLAQADPLDPRHLPADTKWVIHVDADAARDTKTYDTLSTKIFANPEARDGIDKLEQITNARFPDDVKDVTVFGGAAGDEAPVVVIHARVDRKQIERLLKQNPAYGSTAFGDYEILTWQDKDKTSFGAFHDDTTMIIARNAANVQTALDALDGKGETLKPDAPMAAGLKPKQLVYVAACDLKDLHRAGATQRPMLAPIQSAWLGLTEDQDHPVATARLTTGDAASAQTLKQSIDGLRTLLSWTSGGDDADPVAKAASAALASYDAKQTDNAVDITLPIPADKFSALVDAVLKKRGGQ